jgi:parallel beta-helix repeat protein
MVVRALPALLLLAPLAAADTLHVPQDFATIQAAVDASADGDTIVVHKGTYSEAVVVTGKTGLLISGSGKPLIDGTGSEDALTLVGCSNVEVRGLRLTGGSVSDLHVTDSQQLELHHCTIGEAAQIAIFIEGSSEVQVHHNTLVGAGAGWPEAGVRAGDSDHVTVEHNTISFFIDGVRFFSDSAPGAGADDSTIGHNVIHDLWHAGIEAYGTGLQIEQNKITDSGEDGIWLDADDATLTHNKVSQVGDTGILVFDGEGNVIDHNTVSKAAFHGISSSATATGTALIGNKVTSSGSTASLSLEGPGCSSDQDKVSKPQGVGLVLSGTGGSVTGLRIKKPAGVGIELSGGGNTFSDARVSHAGEDGFQVTGDGNTLADCRAMGSDEDGFDVSGASNAFSTCKAKGSGTLDKNDGGADNTFTDCEFGTESP